MKSEKRGTQRTGDPVSGTLGRRVGDPLPPKLTRTLSGGAVAGTDEKEEFADMSEKELRFHKFAELKANWEDTNGRIVPVPLSYLLLELANVWAGSHLAKRHDQREKKRRVKSF